MNPRSYLLATLSLFIVSSVFAQGSAKLVVRTSHPDVTILVDGRFNGEKNTTIHNFSWTPRPNVIFRVPVQATFKGDIKTQTVDIECGKIVRIEFNFPAPNPPPKPVLPPPVVESGEKVIRITHDPIEITGRFEPAEIKPLEIAGPLRVEPLKIEMEPLVITVKNETGDTVEATKDEVAPLPWIDLQVLTMIFLGLSFIIGAVLVTRAMSIQAKVHSELIGIIRGSRRPTPNPCPTPEQDRPPMGDLEVEV